MGQLQELKTTPAKQIPEQPVVPKAERKVTPEHQAKLDKVKALMPKELDSIGTKDDKALQYVKDEYAKFIKENTPTLKEQLNMLTADVKKDGAFDPAKYQEKMLEFQKNIQAGKPGHLPEAVKKIGDELEKIGAAAKPGSEARKAMEALDKKALPEAFPKYMEQRYGELFEKMEAVEAAKAKK